MGILELAEERIAALRGWVSENRLLLVGAFIATLLFEAHFISYHPDPHIEDALDSVVILSDGKGSGTGFFISEDGCLMTAEHVIRGAKNRIIFLRMRGEHKTSEARVVSAMEGMDMAIACAKNVKPRVWLRIVNTENIQRGEPVYALGHTYGKTWNVTNGMISRTGYKMRQLTPKVGMPRYNLWISAFISWGNSGGPVIDSHGRVVGMVVEWDDPGTGVPSNTNIAIPGTDLLRFIRATNGR